MKFFKYSISLSLLLCSLIKANNFESSIDTSEILNHIAESKAFEKMIQRIENGEFNLIHTIITDLKAKGKRSEAFQWALREFACQLIVAPCSEDRIEDPSVKGVAGKVLSAQYTLLVNDFKDIHIDKEYSEINKLFLSEKAKALEWAKKHTNILYYDLENEEDQNKFLKNCINKQSADEKKVLEQQLEEEKEDIIKYYILSFLLLVCTTYSQEGPIMTKRSALRGAHCLPCEGGVSPLTPEQVAEFMIDYPEWQLLEGQPSKIERTFTFKDFVAAMKFVNTVADVAEKEGHHPDITIVYNKVTMQLFTHAIQGLSTNDFIIADLIDDIFQEQ